MEAITEWVLDGMCVSYECECGAEHQDESGLGLCRECDECICDQCAVPGKWDASGTHGLCDACEDAGV